MYAYMYIYRLALLLSMLQAVGCTGMYLAYARDCFVYGIFVHESIRFFSTHPLFRHPLSPSQRPHYCAI